MTAFWDRTRFRLGRRRRRRGRPRRPGRRSRPPGAGPPSPRQGRPRAAPTAAPSAPPGPARSGRRPRPTRRRGPPPPPAPGRSTPPATRPPPERALRPAPGVHCGDIACRFPASSPRAAEARGYGGVHPLDAENPPKMFAMLAACAALTLVIMSLAVPREVEARRRRGAAPPKRSGPGVGPPLVTRRPRPRAGP